MSRGGGGLGRAHPYREAAGQHDGLDFGAVVALAAGVPDVEVGAPGAAGGLGDGLVDVPVGGRAGDAVIAAQGLDPGPVAEPAQRHDRLRTGRQPPAARRRGPQSPLGGQQPGQVANQPLGDVENGTIGDHVESFGMKRNCEENPFYRDSTPVSGTPALSAPAPNAANEPLMTRCPIPFL